MNNYWKHLEIFFSKKVFLEKNSKRVFFFKKSHNAEKLKKDDSGSFNVFTNRKLQKNARGYHLIGIRKFSKKAVA